MNNVKSLVIGLVFVLFASVSQVVFATGAEPGIQAAVKVDVNHAGKAELAEVLKGVGMKKAEAIVLDRQKNGPYKTVEELSRVKGIGASTIDKNRERVRLK